MNATHYNLASILEETAKVRTRLCDFSEATAGEALAKLDALEKAILTAAASLIGKTEGEFYGLTRQEFTVASYADGKIPAIKLYRERTRCGLREAKEAVERAQEKGGLTRPDPNGYYNTIYNKEGSYRQVYPDGV